MQDPDFVAFCRAEHPSLVGALTLWCGRRDVAEEVVQEAFARAYVQWRRVRHLDKPGAWVRRVAINLATSSFRRRQAERRALARIAAQRHDEARDDPDTAAGVTVRRALAELGEAQRTALILRYYLDVPVAEAARIMGRSESAVTSLTQRAAIALRARVEARPAPTESTTEPAPTEEDRHA